MNSFKNNYYNPYKTTNIINNNSPIDYQSNHPTTITSPNQITDYNLNDDLLLKSNQKNNRIPDFYGMDILSPKFSNSTNKPLTKQIKQLAYDIPKNKYVKNYWSYAPEFIKVFSDISVNEGAKVVFDCVLLGSPRPKVIWLFNDEKLNADGFNEQIDDTADLCCLTINRVQRRHYGIYTIVAENEVGRAITSANLTPLIKYYNSYNFY